MSNEPGGFQVGAESGWGGWMAVGSWKVGGRGGIRTHGTVARTSDFESGAFNHSATLPTVDSQALTLAVKRCA